ncbi:hypothetical protein GS416_10430 [Rhodococcus hoagii]|nr:hypothetical protein [Prescottella equi]
MLRVVRHWVRLGVKIFRVDNPHTKPPSLWEWLIAEVKRTDPDVLFLSEAFTRPARLYGLAKRGFTQSYTYFTWRVHKWELTEFGNEIAAKADEARPNLFVNTPDILHESLQHGGPGCSRSGRHSPPRCRPRGACTRGTSCSNTSRSARAARSTSIRRSTSCVRATSPGPVRVASHSNRGSRRSTASGARIRRCSNCGTCISTTSTTTHCWRTRSSTRHGRRGAHRRQSRPVRGAAGIRRAGHARDRA